MDVLIMASDKDGDGKISMMDMWFTESRNWERKMEEEKEIEARRPAFNEVWFAYDANRDRVVDYEELRAARFIIDSEQETE